MKILISIYLFGALVLGARADAGTKSLERRFGNLANLEIIQTASTVTACRLTPPRVSGSEDVDFEKLSDSDALKHYRVGPSVKVDAATVQALRDIILDPAIDDPDSAKGCIPVWGVRFDFTTPARTLSVNLCYQCAILSTSEGARYVGGGDFDPAYAKLVALAKRLFPADAEIQSLKSSLR